MQALNFWVTSNKTARSIRNKILFSKSRWVLGHSNTWNYTVFVIDIVLNPPNILTKRIWFETLTHAPSTIQRSPLHGPHQIRHRPDRHKKDRTNEKQIRSRCEVLQDENRCEQYIKTEKAYTLFMAIKQLARTLSCQEEGCLANIGAQVACSFHCSCDCHDAGLWLCVPGAAPRLGSDRTSRGNFWQRKHHV